MQLGEPEAIGTINNDGVGTGYIDATFNDRGTHENVEAAMIEIEHDLLKFLLPHLSVGDLY